mgnify:CR=1 FL=1
MTELTSRLRAWIDALDAEFLERAAAVRLAVIAPAAGQHLLLVGPPGTAKTMLAQRITEMWSGKLFSTLLTKFSTPEDVFGPLSLPALERGVYARLVEGYLPTADIAFVDEIYKANAAILNSLLSILNERVFFNGAERVSVPLLSMIAASNEVPDDDEGLDALDDRILLRVRVDAVARTESFTRLVDRSMAAAHSRPPSLTRADALALRVAASKVRVPEATVKALLELREACKASQLVVSDRRWRQAVDAMATCAALDEAEAIEPAHLGVLSHVLWRKPADQPKVQDALALALDVMGLSTPTTSVEELKALLEESARELSKLSGRAQQQFGGGWGGQTDSREKVEADGREAMRKAKHVVVAADAWLVAMESELQGRGKLWGPFWADVWTRLDIHAKRERIRTHDFITKRVPAHMPQLASEWG